MRKQSAIVGIGQTEFSKDSGRTEWELALEAILAALDDAGLEPSDVDGIVRYAYDNVTQAMLVRALGIVDLRWYGEIPFGGIAQCGSDGVPNAASLIALVPASSVFRQFRASSDVYSFVFQLAPMNTSFPTASGCAGNGLPAFVHVSPLSEE